MQIWLLATCWQFEGLMEVCFKHIWRKSRRMKKCRRDGSNFQECLDALARAATHGAHFAATRGHHFTLDNVFHTKDIPVRKEQIKMWKRTKRRGLQILHSWAKQRKFWKLVSQLLEWLAMNLMYCWNGSTNQIQQMEKGMRKGNTWKKLDDGIATPFYFLWTEKEELELVRDWAYFYSRHSSCPIAKQAQKGYHGNLQSHDKGGEGMFFKRVARGWGKN